MLYMNSITNLLDLKEVTIKNLSISELEVEIDIEYPVKPHECPNCNYVTSLIHDYRVQKVKDTPIQGKSTIINYRKRRYRCPVCNKRFYEKQNLVPRYHQLTSRFAYYLLTQIRGKTSLSDVAKYNNISIGKIFSILKLIGIDKPKQLPEVLSIDEFRGNAGGKKFQCILTDAKNKKLFDILSGRESHIITDYLKKFDNRHHVKYIVMDMNRAYLEIMKSFFPNATIIIDRFHFVRYNTWAFDNVRRSVQKNLSKDSRKYFKRSRKLLLTRMNKLSDKNKQAVNVMLSFSEKLTKAYLLKEKFYEFVDSEDYITAKEKLKEFLLYAHIQDIKEYSACITMLNNWNEYILNSFEHRYSNGYTEGFNNKIKVVKRNAFGFRNFENFRKRIFLA